MRTTKLILALVIATGLSGCLETDSERALAGAAGGAVVVVIHRKGAITDDNHPSIT